MVGSIQSDIEFKIKFKKKTWGLRLYKGNIFLFVLGFEISAHGLE